MRILITGGCGFIGSHVVKEALNRNFERVVNLDSLTYSGNPKNLHGINDSKYHFIHGSINDGGLVESVILEERIECVIHLAAESHVDRSIRSVKPFVETNIDGTRSLLEAILSSRDNGISTDLIHVSTDEVYGSLGAGERPFSEDSSISPRNPYAATKAASDMLVEAFVNTHKLSASITRCSNNYGPNQFPEKLIPLMTLNAMDGKKLPIYGDGQQVRDWIHVSDHVAGIFSTLDALSRKQIDPGEVFNFGGDCEMTNLEMVGEILLQLDASEDLIEFVPDRPGHDKRYAIDYSKASKLLDWKPVVSFQRGLKETVDWYKNNSDWVKSVRTGEYKNWINEQY